LLEYDDERSGLFDALRHVPEDKMVVLGLVTTKSPRRETVEDLTARLTDASRCPRHRPNPVHRATSMAARIRRTGPA
jgi:methionine synthase II (cobalamin-independent)